MVVFILNVVIFIVSFLVAWLVWKKFQTSKHQGTVPGLTPRLNRDGNMEDIAKAGSLHEFLVMLHKKFGTIASFWYGSTYTVSIADVNMFKKVIHYGEKNLSFFEIFIPLLGTQNLSNTNSEEARRRRKHYGRSFSHSAMEIYFQVYQQAADETVSQLATIPDGEHVCINGYMVTYALKSVISALFGENINEDNFRSLDKLVEVWNELQLRLTVPPTEAREHMLLDEIKKLKEVIREIVKDRRRNPPKHAELLFLDRLIDYSNTDSLLFDESMLFIAAGLHASSATHTWCLYYLAVNEDIQDRVHTEIMDVIGDDVMTFPNVCHLRYLRQVLNETLRCSRIAPYAVRFQDRGTELGGYVLPPGTMVIQAIGVKHMDENIWPEPNKFDPDRFSPGNRKNIPNLAFVPFGFAGGRQCPGSSLFFTEASVLMATLLKTYKVELVEGQDIRPFYGLVTYPSDVWLKLSNDNSLYKSRLFRKS